MLAVVLSLIALVLTSSALNWVTEARASSGARKAVIVSGPVHGLTAKYKRYAAAIADAAEAQGMETWRLFHPRATKAKVKRHADGADLFVYVGHGNGWPSAYGKLQEDSKNGLGLNPEDTTKRTTGNVVYWGANWIKENITFAPDAVVILSHLSYASGNASSGMAIPSREVAVQRVDNYANGFLAAGARVVWALGWQPGADVIAALHTTDASMDAIFTTQYREGVSPLNGWIGANPGRYESVRTPGAAIHIDPDPARGYLRAVTGDLSFTTTQWRDRAALPSDGEPPVISDVQASQAGATVATGTSPLAVFTPNGDGLSDGIRISHALSENAHLDVRVIREGRVVRQMSVWALRGPGSLTWDGRRRDGKYVGEGKFRIVITPSDRVGNTGAPAEVRVKALSSIKSPTAKPAVFHPGDGDDLAGSVELRARLTRPGAVSWIIRDAAGTAVRKGMEPTKHGPGVVRFVWDGTDDAGNLVPQGKYTGRVRVTRPQGAYGHDVTMHMMPFKVRASRWKLGRGERAQLVIETAEPLQGKPIVTANQPGIKKYVLKVSRVNERVFKATLATRPTGNVGHLKLRVAGDDTGGRSQGKVFAMELR